MKAIQPGATNFVFPDLLQPVPSCRIDPEVTGLALVMAFAGGTSGGLFADALAQARQPVSSFTPSAYARDLFLTRFVSDCFGVQVRSAQPSNATEYTLRLLASPPKDAAVVAHRRAVIEELSHSPALRAQLERVYTLLSRFRTTLEGTAGQVQFEATRRQVSILELFRDLVETLASGFENAQSGLSTLHCFGQQVKASEGYQSLVALLAYDEQLASIRFNVSIGADGRVRQLVLEEVREHTDNPFVSPPWRRWLAKLELFVRGFRFGDGEVMARLLDAVFEGVRPYFLPFIQLLGDLEFYLGALSFNDRARAAGLEVCLPELVGVDEPREVLGLFNPLLLGQHAPVPCDIRLDRQDATVLITGPNSGGKTRLLQALALSQLLAQAGLYVPARTARLSLAPGLVVSLLQETHVDQSEGRLGMELMRIRALFETLPPGAMVILDELCSGTNPSEGEEIFELVVRMLARLRPQAFITTHFLDFAGRLERDRRIDTLRFLQVVLGESQQPTYQFASGVAKTSLAAQAAARLGVTGDQLLALVERSVASAERRGS